MQNTIFQHRVFQLDKTRKEPLYLQLYQQIKQDISNGNLSYGQKLPSKRKIAEDLVISRNTVETAYGQLLAEGYIEAKSRTGFFVSFKAEQFFIQPSVKLQKNKKNKHLNFAMI